MPTPPTGDMACAASPMQRSPGRYHLCRRSTRTLSKLTSSQSRSSVTRSPTKEAMVVMLVRKASSPRARICSIAPLGITYPHGQYSLREIMMKICSLLREEIQEVPLRYENNKLAAGREMSEVCERDRRVSNIRAEFVRLLVWQLQKFFEQPKFVQRFECRGVNRVTAEVPEKI